MTAETAKKRRPRRVASDEAHAWARSLPLNNPNAKTVLRALALYVNGEGCCFVGIDQLSEDTDLSPDTVRRRLQWLEQVSAIVRLPQWLDANGVRNGEGRGKRTTDEIRLLLDADLEEIEHLARGEEAPVSAPSSEEINPSSQQGLNHIPENAPEIVGPRLALGQPSQSCEGLTSEPEPLNSPQPPSGGTVELEGWKEFQGDWAEPILRQSLAQQVWAVLKPEERELVRRAARGYGLWLKSQKRPPNRLSAHLFLKERDAWEKFAKLAPSPGSPAIAGTYDSESLEGKAIVAMYAVARSYRFEGQRRVVYPGEITPQILAFAEVSDRPRAIWIEDRNNIGAWSRFLGSHVFGSRPELVDTRGIGAAQRSGIWAPHPWPPKKDGTWSTTGPPETLMSEQDFADFK